MREILSDLVAESQFLDQFLQKIKIADWDKPTPAKGWTIRDQISHLADSSELAADAINGGSRIEEYRSAPNLDVLRQAATKRGRKMRPQDVIEWWRGGRAKVVEPLSHMRPDQRIEWIVGSMSARTFATMRLMEDWAHGLDIYAAMGATIEDTARIRHISWLGWKTLPYAFKAADLDYSPVRIEVMGPAYAKWVYGPADTDQVIKGPAGEWARLAVRRIKRRDAKNLKATGEVAETALEVVKAYV
ncbi:MAG TPA: maleylpyruvate isomerase family mycothiol-dependent enzyme [Acidimicrobiia bacterium]